MGLEKKKEKKKETRLEKPNLDLVKRGPINLFQHLENSVNYIRAENEMFSEKGEPWEFRPSGQT